MATHSSTLAWKIPWTEEPVRLQFMGSLRVRHDWVTSLFTFHFHALEKEMATHSSILAWRIPGTEEPSGLPSMGLHRVGHNWSDLATAAAAASVYLRLLIFLPAILIAVCASSSPAFHMMDSAYKLNKQDDNMTALTYSFPNFKLVCCSMSGSNSCFLTCIQVLQEAGKVPSL